MTTYATEADMLGAVLAEPDEDAPRLVMADWLEDRDAPGDRERAEFIRAQCELALLRKALVAPDGDSRVKALWRRERELLDGASPAPGMANVRGPAVSRLVPRLIHHRLWAGATLLNIYEADNAHVQWSFRRGFVHAVTLSADAWLEHADALLAVAPVREVTLTTWPAVEHVHDVVSVEDFDADAYTRPIADAGRVRLAGRTFAHGIDALPEDPEHEGPLSLGPHNFGRRDFARGLARRLLAAEWPGLTFRLPV